MVLVRLSEYLVERKYVMRDVKVLFTLIGDPKFYHKAKNLTSEVLNYIVTSHGGPIDYHEVGHKMLGNRIIPVFEGVEACPRTVIDHLKRCVEDEEYHRNQTELLIYTLRVIHDGVEPDDVFLQDYYAYDSPIPFDERPLSVSPRMRARANRLYGRRVDPAKAVQIKRGRRQALKTIEELYGRGIAKYVKKGYPIDVESPTGQLFLINTRTGRVYNKDWSFLCINVGRDVVLLEDRIMVLISVIRSGLIYSAIKPEPTLEGLEELIEAAVV